MKISIGEDVVEWFFKCFYLHVYILKIPSFELDFFFNKWKRETNSLCEELKNLSRLAMTASMDFFSFKYTNK